MKKYALSRFRVSMTMATVSMVSLSLAAQASGYQTPHPVYNNTHKMTVQARASDEVIQGAQNFIENVSARGLAFLQNKNMSEAQRKKEFRSLLTDSFDLQTIGRFALGRHWRQATEEQKKEYMKLFESMVIDTYTQRFGEYQGQQVVVNKARSEGDKDAIVNSKIVSTDGSPDVQLDWRVRYKGGEYRIIDVLVEGVSMSLTQRSEFSSIIQRGGGSIDPLLEKLRER